MDNTDEDTTTDDWSLEQPLAQTRTTAIVEVKGAINVVLTPLVAESLDRYRLCGFFLEFVLLLMILLLICRLFIAHVPQLEMRQQVFLFFFTSVRKNLKEK